MQTPWFAYNGTFSLNIKNCYLHVICEKQDQIWEKIFCIPKNNHSRTPMMILIRVQNRLKTFYFTDLSTFYFSPDDRMWTLAYNNQKIRLFYYYIYYSTLTNFYLKKNRFARIFQN